MQQHVKNYYTYQQIKVVQDIYYSLLQPLPVPKQLWVNVIIDFVMSLLKYRAYNQVYNVIFIIADQLSKKNISCSRKNKEILVTEMADLFI